MTLGRVSPHSARLSVRAARRAAVSASALSEGAQVAAKVTGRANRPPRPDRRAPKTGSGSQTVIAPGLVRSQVGPDSSTHGRPVAFARCCIASNAQRDIAWRPGRRGSRVDTCGTLPSPSRASTLARGPRDERSVMAQEPLPRRHTGRVGRDQVSRWRRTWEISIQVAQVLETKRRSNAIRWPFPSARISEHRARYSEAVA